MEITKEQLSKLREKLGDNELKEMGFDLPIDECKIYVVLCGGDIYKAHQLNHDIGKQKFAWVGLDDSFSWANGDFDSLKECLNSMPEYKTFENVKKLAVWITAVKQK